MVPYEIGGGKRAAARLYYCKKDAMPSKFPQYIILAVLLGPFISPFPSYAGPIFPEQALREEALWTPEAVEKILPITVKNSGKKLETLFTIDARDGLNAEEAPLLALLINPRLRSIRKKKGLVIPQLIQSGALSPIGLIADKAVAGRSWLPPGRLELAMESVRAMAGKSAQKNSIDLEVSWLEWQTLEYTKFHLYRQVISRRVIDMLRRIQNVYKDIYKATSEARVQRLYPDLHGTAKLGYEKMKQSMKIARDKLSFGRVGIDHALGLPTYLEVPLENDMSLPIPGDLPALKTLTEGLNYRRIDLMALQKGIKDKDVPMMNYIYSRFARANLFVPFKTRAQWLDTAGAHIAIDLPMFSGSLGVNIAEGVNGKRLYKDLQKRITMAKADIAELLKGIGFIREELERIDKTLPILIKEVKDRDGKGNAVEALKAKKTLMAVRLMRLRLRGRLLDALVALEADSGRILIKASAP